MLNAILLQYYLINTFKIFESKSDPALVFLSMLLLDVPTRRTTHYSTVCRSKSRASRSRMCSFVLSSVELQNRTASRLSGFDNEG